MRAHGAGRARRRDPRVEGARRAARTREDAASVVIDPEHVLYRALADLPGADEKTVRDAGTLAVTDIAVDPGRERVTHPVLRVLGNGRQRCRNGDGARVALVVEGGGMRGCVSGGMGRAVHEAGLTERFDAATALRRAGSTRRGC